MSNNWNGYHPPLSAVLAFNILQLIGTIGMLLLSLIAAFSSSVHRNTTWFCFCLSWIISGVSFSLLLTLGQVGRSEPAETICLAQASLIYAAPPLTICTTGSLLVPIWYNLRRNPSKGRLSQTHSALLLAIPYLIWIAFIALIFTLSSHNLSLVRLNDRHTYCVVDHPVISKITPIFVAIVTCAVLILAGYITWRMYRMCANCPHDSQATPTSVLRILVFSLLCFVALCFDLFFAVKAMPAIGFDIALACLPVSGVLIFGSQQDILQSWMCCGAHIRKVQYEKLFRQESS